MVNLDFTDELAIVIGDDFVYTFEFEDESCEPIDQMGNTFDAILTSKTGEVLETFATAVSGNSVELLLADSETAVLAPTKTAKWRLRQTVGSITTTIIIGKVEVVEV